MPRPVAIMLVEDDADDARLVELALERTGIDHRLEVVTTGEAALDRLLPPPEGEDAFDLVLLDVSLPGVDGYAVLGRLRTGYRHRPLRIALQTSVTARRAGEKGRRLGADRVFAKPVTSDELEDAIELALGASSGHEQPRP